MFSKIMYAVNDSHHETEYKQVQQVMVVWLWLSDVISALIYSLETECVLFYPKLLQPHL